jgi:hypothetical protein
MRERSYEQDLEIDANNLDKEWLGYPRKLAYWINLEVEAQEEKDQAERNLEVVEAQMDEKIRLKPEVYGLEKVTEPSIKNAAKRSKEIEQANQRLIAAKKKARLLSGAVKTIEKTDKAMQHLGELWAAGYWSGKDMPKGVRQAVEEKRRGEQIRALNRKMKKGEDE